MLITVVIYILGRNLFTLEGGLGSGPFMITPTRWCGKGCPHVRPHSSLTNLEFGRVYLHFCWDTFGLSSGEKKNVGVEPRLKKLQPTCDDRAANLCFTALYILNIHFVLMRGTVSRRRWTYIKVFLNNESICHFMVVQLFKLSTKEPKLVLICDIYD